ncbi:1-deoxy-D-xylulose-5-phosphate synthase [Desulfobacula sp.]|uniref:1-deoxy-D-xylulose-5-phosphate synthase n=1 Tax=Desulfobacula sp. TaxID=2593537 RepID=UPI0025B8764D|nr:1-deoxy-D-xylulose-5-phosphate synthase [Desulfobacula sp.]MBC2704378.1 1-deoxy-D-xylulose-5-phosphate synthase [Desulfobacula sp.]
MSLLEHIKTSKDIKQLSRPELKLLAGEIRKRIIDVVSKNGGHLASSLGAVELTLAIHTVFDLPKDTLIWDVGHQSYAHKLITGRNDTFDSLRQYKGLSGFSKIKESPYDGFTVGHSSTSISAGLGICYAKYLNKDVSDVISVIGDGSLTAGLAYEGLNQTGDSKRNLIVILNDNDMSISPNVGALSSFLSRTFSARSLQSMRSQFGAFLKSLPKIGDDMYNIAKRSEESFKTFVTPGMLFEAFNFDYFGPIDGHNLDHLIDILKNIKNPKDPVLLHVTTVKGKGYEPAEKNPIYFHGVDSFAVETGKSKKISNGIPSYTQVFGSQMVKLAKTNKKIVAVTAAMPEGTGLVEFSQHYPDRFFDVGIAEQHAVTFSAGLASKGLKPVVAIYSTFLQRAFDQILHDVCIDAHPVVFAIDRGGIVGKDGPTHHGLFDYSYLRCMPNMTIMAPSNENELARMLSTAVKHDGPVAIRYPRGIGLGVQIEAHPRSLKMGKGEVICDGHDLLIIAIGKSVCEALKACEQLKDHDISVTIINARFVKPLDAELICEYVLKIRKTIIVEDHVLDGGFGSAVLEMLSDKGMTGFPIKRIGIKNEFVEHGPQDVLRRDYGIDHTAIVTTALKLHDKTIE